jgi:hypothetical protein
MEAAEGAGATCREGGYIWDRLVRLIDAERVRLDIPDDETVESWMYEMVRWYVDEVIDGDSCHRRRHGWRDRDCASAGRMRPPAASTSASSEVADDAARRGDLAGA